MRNRGTAFTSSPISVTQFAELGALVLQSLGKATEGLDAATVLRELEHKGRTLSRNLHEALHRTTYGVAPLVNDLLETKDFELNDGPTEDTLELMERLKCDYVHEAILKKAREFPKTSGDSASLCIRAFKRTSVASMQHGSDGDDRQVSIFEVERILQRDKQRAVGLGSLLRLGLSHPEVITERPLLALNMPVLCHDMVFFEDKVTAVPALGMKDGRKILTLFPIESEAEKPMLLVDYLRFLAVA